MKTGKAWQRMGFLDFGSWLWGFWISQADLIQPPNSYRIQQQRQQKPWAGLEVNSTWKCSFLEVVNLKFDLVGPESLSRPFFHVKNFSPQGTIFAADAARTGSFSARRMLRRNDSTVTPLEPRSLKQNHAATQLNPLPLHLLTWPHLHGLATVGVHGISQKRRKSVCEVPFAFLSS